MVNNKIFVVCLQRINKITRMKTNKIIYWITTGLLSLMLLMSSGMYIFNNDEIRQAFETFGYPTYLIYPLVAAKLSAVVILLSQKGSIIREWVYAGLFFEFTFAFFAHVMIGDGDQIGAVMAMALLMGSYFSEKRINILKNVA